MKTWVENESVLFHKTGQTKKELVFVWATAKKALANHYKQHHTQHTPPLSPYESLLATLYWLRVYPSTTCIAAELSVDQKSVRECIDHTIEALFTSLVPACFDHSKPPPVVWNTGTLAGVCAVVDATWLTLPHNPDKAERKQNFYKKMPYSPCTQVAA